jgi:hypothetical protein
LGAKAEDDEREKVEKKEKVIRVAYKLLTLLTAHHRTNVTSPTMFLKIL